MRSVNISKEEEVIEQENIMSHRQLMMDWKLYNISSLNLN